MSNDLNRKKEFQHFEIRISSLEILTMIVTYDNNTL